ncbi:helix-turn-helix domain-containing protein [Gabonibacter chumensis]|uniref:helix-turn-helix domain-containing protein n=1 Tax=Gabonibacter chumensis TaxID=2972474 RepID=UPI0025743C4D|nr:helix-turn-helix domain-containing protein [Gabonibacter chumensis]MCR9012652.1 helix-turn-helix domain-containing protein [Gabonibacter chumensis]
MSWDYLNSESEEVKKAFSQIRDTERALQKAIDNYRPSVTGEYYLNGEEVCEYLHISPRTLQTLRDRRQIPYTVISGRVFLYPETGIREALYKNFRPIEDPF